MTPPWPFRPWIERLGDHQFDIRSEATSALIAARSGRH